MTNKSLNFIIVLLLTITSFFYISCEKEDDTIDDKYSITIVSKGIEGNDTNP